MIPIPENASETPYASFWMAGFEGADHVNGNGQPQDLVRSTGHLACLEADYARVARFGLRTIRESVGWRLAEPIPRAPGASRFDLSRLLRCSDAASCHGVQPLWTLMHYGFPSGVDVFSDDFEGRFADFAATIARAMRGRADRAPVYTPVNEISFLAWAIAESDLVHPYRHESRRRQGGELHVDVGWEAKWRLVRAALLAMAAVRAEDASARFLHVEPLIHIVPPQHSPHLAERASEVADYQWQTWDMLDGALLPELGGSPAALDLLGVNYYHNCQWEMDGPRLEWHLGDERRVPFSRLLHKVWARYDRPMIVSETSHVGEGRPRWIEDVVDEVSLAMAAGVPVQGICLYPVIDRPDWNDASHWHNSGLWDAGGAGVSGDASLERRLHLGYAKSLRRAQRRLGSSLRPIDGQQTSSGPRRRVTEPVLAA